MSRYYFDLYDGVEIIDEDGMELASIENARRHAVLKMAELLMQAPDKFWAGDAWTLKVKDDLGLTLFTLNFSAAEAAVVASSTPASR